MENSIKIQSQLIRIGLLSIVTMTILAFGLALKASADTSTTGIAPLMQEALTGGNSNVLRETGEDSNYIYYIDLSTGQSVTYNLKTGVYYYYG